MDKRPAGHIWFTWRWICHKASAFLSSIGWHFTTANIKMSPYDTSECVIDLMYIGSWSAFQSGKLCRLRKQFYYRRLLNANEFKSCHTLVHAAQNMVVCDWRPSAPRGSANSYKIPCEVQILVVTEWQLRLINVWSWGGGGTCRPPFTPGIKMCFFDQIAIRQRFNKHI